MKNFDYNSYHPYGAYSNHSYNNYNNNNNSNSSSTCHLYTQQQQQQQQLQHHHPHLTLPLPFPHNHQQPQQRSAALTQQQLLQQQQQQQHRRQNPPQSLQQPHLATINQSANTSSTHNNNNNNTGSALLNMQATATYANFYANYNQNHNQNHNNHNYNHNYNGQHQHQHVSSNQQQQQQHQHQQQQHQYHHYRNMVAAQQELSSSSSPTTSTAVTASGSSGSSSNVADKFTMDACEIANFLANELFMQQLVSVDGIQSGVPTLTTSTLTPTTLRSIEETFTQLISEPINAPYQAGFIPPPLAPFPSAGTSTTTAAPTTFNTSVHDFNDQYETESEDSQGSWSGAQLNEENSMATTDTSSAATDSTSFQNGLNGMGNNSMATSNTSSNNDFTSVNIALVAAAAAAAAAKNSGGSIHNNNKNTSNSATTTRRNQGGRRPAKSTNMSPEEEEKRRIRRERNKLAAARCRKRRVDQTNELLEEVAILEKKREGLQKDIESLNTTKQELEYILEAHRPTCQKVRQDLLSVSTYGGLIAPTTSSSSNHSNITGMDATLAATARNSPIDLKPELLPDNMLDVVQHIKNEPLDDTGLDSPCSSLDHDGPPSPKRIFLTRNNPMIPPPLPNVATLSPALAAASASLNTPIVTTAPVSFSSFNSNSNTTLNALNTMSKPQQHPNGSKQRPNTLPTIPRNLAQSLGMNVDGKPPTDINGVAIQTPSAGMFNFESLMDGGTGLTPVSGPLVPNCSSQNKHPLELTTPTSEPSKLVSL